MRRWSLSLAAGAVLVLGVSGRAVDGAGAPGTNAVVKAGLPKLVDLGADKCIPCKMMIPVLADLKTNYVGQLEVEFIDVWKNPDAGKAYKSKLIPTQIFYDAKGGELYRHEGFFSKKDILAKWAEFDVELKAEDQPVKREMRGRGSK